MIIRKTELAVVMLICCLASNLAKADIFTKSNHEILINRENLIVETYFPKKAGPDPSYKLVVYTPGGVEFVKERDLQFLEPVINSGYALAVIRIKNSGRTQKIDSEFNQAISALFALRPLKFQKKFCLVGERNGADINYSFAFRTPNKVACMLNISAQLSSQKENEKYKNGIKILAKIKVPIFHIHGNRGNSRFYQMDREFIADYLRDNGVATFLIDWDSGDEITTLRFAPTVSNFLTYHMAK